MLDFFDGFLKTPFTSYVYDRTMTPQEAIQIANDHIRGGRNSAADQLARQVLAVEPNHPDALGLVGLVAFASSRFDDAHTAFAKAVEASKSPAAIPCYRLGETLRQLVHVEESIPWFERAIALDPNLAEAHLSLALALMTLDRYDRGFEEFEWRWRSQLLNTQRIQFHQPTWDGSDPKGRTFLLWAEQGLGDVIHSARYATLLAERGAKVVIGCQAPLERLMRTVPGVAFATTHFDQTPPFDLQISTFSLMRAFRTTYDTIPTNVPYVHADPSIVQKWKEKLSSDRAAMKVGLIWGGSTTNPTDRMRSIPVTALAPLAGARNASFYSLQTDQRSAEALLSPPALQLKPLGHLLTDFAETAGLLMNLDLLISVDTAAVHLAGALGRPVWALLAHMNDWRWGLARTDNKWYPTARLFRQKARGDWNQVIGEVATELISGRPRS